MGIQINRYGNDFFEIISFADGALHNLYENNEEIERLVLDNNLSHNDIDQQYYPVYTKDSNSTIRKINDIRGKIFFDGLSKIKGTPTNIEEFLKIHLDQSIGENYIYIINFHKSHLIYNNEKIKLPKHLMLAVADMNNITTISLDNNITEDYNYIDSDTYKLQDFNKYIKENDSVAIAILYTVLHLDTTNSSNFFNMPNPYYEILKNSNYDYKLITNMDQFDFFK